MPTEYRREQKKQEALRQAGSSNSLDSDKWENEEEDTRSSHSSSGHSPDASTCLQEEGRESSEKKPKLRRDSLGHYVHWLKVKKLRKHLSKLGHGHDSGDGPQLDALLLRCDHWLEAVDEQHRYGSNLRPYFDYWLVHESELDKGAVDEWVEGEMGDRGQSVELTFDDEDGRDAVLDAIAAREAKEQVPAEETKKEPCPALPDAPPHLPPRPDSDVLPASTAEEAAPVQLPVVEGSSPTNSLLPITRSPPRSISAQHLPAASTPPVIIGGSPCTPAVNISFQGGPLPPVNPSSLPMMSKTRLPHPHPHPPLAKDKGSMPNGGWQVLLEAVAMTAMQGSGGGGGSLSRPSCSAPGSLGSSPHALPGKFANSLSHSELHNELQQVVLGGSPVGSSHGTVVPFNLGPYEDEEEQGADDKELGAKCQREEEEEEALRDLLIEETNHQGQSPPPSSSPLQAEEGGADPYQGFFDTIKDKPQILGLPFPKDKDKPPKSQQGHAVNPQDMFHRISLQDPADQSLHRRNFFAWLDYGPGKSLDLAEQGVPRSKLDSERVRYLSPQELEKYEVVVDRETGLLKYKLSGALLHTYSKDDQPSESSNNQPNADSAPPPPPPPPLPHVAMVKDNVGDATKDGETNAVVGSEAQPAVVPTQKDKREKDKKWIWVVAPDGKLYVHAKIRGQFHHSSFLRGSVVMAAGNMLAEHGKLVKLTADSGHYWPKPDHFRWFFEHLKSQGADLSAPAIRGLEATGYTTKH